MMNVTGLAKGLTQIGQYALARKQQDFKTKEMYALEQLKNEMWNRKLRQQTQQAESQRQFLMKKFETEQREETLRQQSKHDFELQKEREKRDAELNPETLENRLKAARIREIENKVKSGYYAKHKDEKDQSLQDLLGIVKGTTPEFTTDQLTGIKEPIKGTGNKKLYDLAMEGIKQYGKTKLGFTEPQNNQTVSPEMQEEYDQLINAGLDPQSALLLLQQNYSQQGMRNMPPQRVVPKGTQPKKNEGDVFELGL